MANLFNRNLTPQWVPIDSVKPNPRNARKHSKRQIRQVAESLLTFSWTNPILVDDKGAIIAGHARHAAATHLQLSHVPVVRISDMTDAQKRAYAIADNRLAELAGWDFDLLSGEFEFLSTCEINFSLEITGFDTVDLDRMLGAAAKAPAEVISLPPSPASPVTRVGDYWGVGDHRLLCGDTRDLACVERLLAGEKAQLILTDPPYNVRIAGNVSGLGKRVHSEFVAASGEMAPREFETFLADTIGNLVAKASDGTIAFVFMDWRHMGEMLVASSRLRLELKNLIVWAKTNAGMGAFYRSQHELIFAFKVGTAPHINNFGLGSKRYRTNVWEYAGVNAFREGREEDLAAHPTVKPVALLADAIMDCSRRKGIVLDGFAGVGSTLIAAEMTGRRGFGIELDPAYVDIALQRLWRETGEEPVLEDGRSWSEVRDERVIDREAA